MFHITAKTGFSPVAAEPQGLLLQESSWTRKQTSKWAHLEERASMFEVVVGGLLVLLSLHYLHAFSSFTGQLLGGLLIASGVLGWIGGTRRSPGLVNLHLLCCVIGIVLALTWIGEITREREVHCALAELDLRTQHTHELAVAAQRNEALHAVMERLSEMDDALTLAQASAVAQVQLKTEQEKLKAGDLAHVTQKLELVKQHAEKLLDSVLNSPDVTPSAIVGMSEAEKSALRRRLDVADRALDRIKKHHAGGEPMTYEDYAALLQALGDEPTASADLQAAKADLANTKAAFDRTKADAYHSLPIGHAAQQVSALDAYRAQRREEWEKRFASTLAQRQQAGRSFVADLPEFCVAETRGVKRLAALGVVAVLLQAFAAYCALGLGRVLPKKGE